MLHPYSPAEISAEDTVGATAPGKNFFPFTAMIP